MTPPDDSSRDSPHDDGPLDEDAAWRAIVENYGERPDLNEPSPGAAELPPRPPSRSAFDRAYLEAVEAAREAREPEPAADEPHFVPPDPPPVPRGTPARRLAWLGLLAPPVLMFVAVVLHRTMPSWLVLVMVAGFIGGFGFLVATMPRGPRDDGDDGAVV
ncbi:MAG: hypothetical protein WB441_09090 [Nocardioidaceae bacterium]